jgi:nitrogen-specific signal transduction histidine kinase
MEFRSGRDKLNLHVVLDVSEKMRLEQRLRESEKMEALGRLVGGVAHDFNNVLTAITLYSDLLSERAAGLREAEEIKLAAQRGTAIVRQLLTFARQQPLAPRVVCLQQIITPMRGMLEPLLGEDIELITDFSCAYDLVRVDPVQIQQVILNLVMNARDAMPNGGQVRIATGCCTLTAKSAQRHPGLRAGDYVTLIVADTGCGMDEHVRARIFEPFFTTKPAGQGIGLGMAMTYGIVRQSDGAVAVASKPGAGTRVTIQLPRYAGNLAKESIGDDAAVTPTGTETILLVEDDQAVRASIAHLLTAAGYRVLQARDGDQALRLARSQTGAIDLLITDVVMPGMSGFDVAQQVEKLHNETEVLFISGYAAQARAKQGIKLLHKPFTRAQLTEKVRIILDQRPAAAVTVGGTQAERELS